MILDNILTLLDTFQFYLFHFKVPIRQGGTTAEESKPGDPSVILMLTWECLYWNVDIEVIILE